jgi:hypothetical protein
MECKTVTKGSKPELSENRVDALKHVATGKKRVARSLQVPSTLLLILL